MLDDVQAKPTPTTTLYPAINSTVPSFSQDQFTKNFDDFFDRVTVMADEVAEAVEAEELAFSEESTDVDGCLEEILPPTMSEKALVGIAGDFVKLATERSDADPAAVLITFLARVGVEFGPKNVFQFGDTLHPPRLFAAVIGATAAARKGTSAEPVKRLFNVLGDLKTDLAQTCDGPLSTGEGLIERVKDVEVVQKKGGTVVTGTDDKRLFVLEAEFSRTLTAAKRTGNTILSMLLSFWDHGNVEPLTKTNKIKTTGAHVGIVAHSTFEVLQKVYPEQEFWSGLGNRFLWIFARKRKTVKIPEAMDSCRLKDIATRIQYALSLAQESTLGFSAAGRDYWIEIYDLYEATEDGKIGAILSRSHVQILRIALIYALLDCESAVDVAHLKAAEAVWDYSFSTVKYLFSNYEQDPVEQRILEGLKKQSLTMTGISKLFGNHGDRMAINSALKKMIAQNRVELVSVKTAGRSKTLLALKK